MNSGHVVRSLRPAATTMGRYRSHRRRYSGGEALLAGLEQNRTEQNFLLSQHVIQDIPASFMFSGSDRSRWPYAVVSKPPAPDWDSR